MVDAVYEALAAADWVLCRLGIRYVIMAGTLLGAMRHGGMISWDDDADLRYRYPFVDIFTLV